MSDWKKMEQWELVLPPSRPTKYELERVRAFLTKINRDKPIAVLGSTPEFRDLLFGMGFKNRYIFDKSKDFYHRMSHLIPAMISDDEKLIDGDWLESVRLYQNFFSVILSDLTMGNLPYEKRGDFYYFISNSLEPGGCFIDKVLAFDFVAPTITNLFMKYETLPINLRTINDFSSEVLFCSELVVDSGKVDSSELYKYIDEHANTDKIKFFSRAARMITPEGFVWYYGIPWSKLSDEYSKYYSYQSVVINEEVDSPYFHRTKQFFNIK